MTYDTSGTSADPELGTEGDTDQLSGDDTLDPTYLRDDYEPADQNRTNHWGETPWEEAHGEPQGLRLAEEEPEVWDADRTEGSPGTESSGVHLTDDPDGRFSDDL